MFAKKKKAVFENSATIAPPPSSVTNSSGKSASYDPQFYASDKKTKPKMLSPPPAVPAAPVPQSNTVSDNNSVAKQLIFHCQLAHGSQTGFITGFSSVRELYQKIADYYEFPVEEVTNRCCCHSILPLMATNLTKPSISHKPSANPIRHSRYHNLH